MDMVAVLCYGMANKKNREKNSKAQYYLKDGRLLQHESTWIFER
ncbi:MAG: hypothetical protein ACLTJ5_12925 [Clostridium sp.]